MGSPTPARGGVLVVAACHPAPLVAVWPQSGTPSWWRAWHLRPAHPLPGEGPAPRPRETKSCPIVAPDVLDPPREERLLLWLCCGAPRTGAARMRPGRRKDRRGRAGVGVYNYYILSGILSTMPPPTWEALDSVVGRAGTRRSLGGEYWDRRPQGAALVPPPGIVPPSYAPVPRAAGSSPRTWEGGAGMVGDPIL